MYVSGVLWAVSFTGPVLVLYRHAGIPGQAIIGRGPRLVRFGSGKSRLDWRLWPWAARACPQPGARSPSLTQEALVLRLSLWSWTVVCAVLCALAFALPAQPWIFATAAVVAVFGLNGLLVRRPTTSAGQLRQIKTFPAAMELRLQAKAAFAERDFDAGRSISRTTPF
jgi:hypothetical protein